MTYLLFGLDVFISLNATAQTRLQPSDTVVLGINPSVNGRQYEDITTTTWIAAILWDLCHHPALTNGLVPNVVHVNMFPWQWSFQSWEAMACNVPRNASLEILHRETVFSNFYLKRTACQLTRGPFTTIQLQTLAPEVIGYVADKGKHTAT